MGRLHLFEFEDQPWFPALVRGYMTDYLAFAARMATRAPFAGFAARLAAALEATGDRQLVDLCSGAGGPLPQVLEILRDHHGLRVNAVLTDLHPNHAALSGLASTAPGIGYEEGPVDATAVPPHLDGFRTLFNGFHHFPPQLARSILEDAARSSKGIAVLELVNRTPLGMLTVASMVLTMPLLTPFLRPFRMSRLLLTSLLPLVPLFTLWDGLVSCLRVYSPDELRELTAGIGEGSYQWEIGTMRVGWTPARVTYLIGRPAGGGVTP